jgi:predicted DNA-binding transcriptional regulator YafY
VNRTDRLHALGEELRRAGSRGRTSSQLAATFEVSERTVKRDVSALQQAGLPVWAQAGPGGGYVLDAVADLPPVNLTAAQAVAVAVALAAAPDAPFAADGRAALEKILDVLDPGARRRAEQLGGRLWVRGNEGRLPVSRARAAVEQALVQRLVVALRYRDRHGRPSTRRVEPHLVARTGGHWYLLAWCLERDAARWFRWDRIEGAAVTTEPVRERDPSVFGEPPDDARPVRQPEPGNS